MILWTAIAAASSLVVVIREEDRAFSGAIPRLQLTDAAGRGSNVNLGDQGSAPDETAGDGIWTGETRDAGSGPFSLLVSDGGDALRWTGSFSPEGDPAVISLRVAPGGVIGALPRGELAWSPPKAGDLPPAPAGGGGGATVKTSASTESPSSPEATPLSPGRVLAQAFLVAVAAWVAAGIGRFGPASLAGRPGRRPALPGKGPTAVRAEAGELVRALAGPFRVVVAGEAGLGEVPEGTVFELGPTRSRVEDLGAWVRHLEHGGPPLVVVVAGPLEGAGGLADAEARARLGRLLPRGVRVFFVDPTAELGMEAFAGLRPGGPAAG